MLSTGLGVMMAVDLLCDFGHILTNCALMDANCGEKVNELHQNLDIILVQFPIEPNLLKCISNAFQWSGIIIIVMAHMTPLGVIWLAQLSVNQHKFFQFVQIQPDDPMDMGCSSLLELHFEAVELNIHWVSTRQKNLGDECLDTVLKVPTILESDSK